MGGECVSTAFLSVGFLQWTPDCCPEGGARAWKPWPLYPASGPSGPAKEPRPPQAGELAHRSSVLSVLNACGLSPQGELRGVHTGQHSEGALLPGPWPLCGLPSNLHMAPPLLPAAQATPSTPYYQWVSPLPCPSDEAHGHGARLREQPLPSCAGHMEHNLVGLSSGDGS